MSLSFLFKLEDFSSIDTDTLFDVRDSVHDLLCEIAKASTVQSTQALEESMYQAISEAWETSANNAISDNIEVIKGSVSRRSIKKFLGNISKALSTPLTPRQHKIAQRHLLSIWRIAKRTVSRSFDFSPSFSQFDSTAVKILNNHQMYWIGNFYSDHLGKRISKVAREVLIEKGLGHEHAANSIRRELGLIEGGKTSYAKSVPSKYAGNPKLYFEQVVSNAAHQARTFSSITAMDEAGINLFRLSNPMDRRTGQKCQIMNGQTFTVKSGKAQMLNVLSADTPDKVKEASPWLSLSELKSVVGGAEKGSDKATASLEDAKVILPPFHGKCRTEVIAVTD